MRTISRIILHHAGITATLEEIDRWHRDRGWDGVGYHFVIEASGRVRLGRQVHVIGAHAKGHNADSIGVCVAVDARNGVPPRAWEALAYLVRDLMRQYNIGPGDVMGHRDVGNTECPGYDARELLDVIAWLDAPPVQPPQE